MAELVMVLYSDYTSDLYNSCFPKNENELNHL